MTKKAFTIDEFCKAYGIGKTRAYEEIKEKRLKARKMGRRTLISKKDADDWFDNLDPFGDDFAPYKREKNNG